MNNIYWYIYIYKQLVGININISTLKKMDFIQTNIGNFVFGYLGTQYF